MLPREAVYQQTQHWLKAGVFEHMTYDLRLFLHLIEGRTTSPSAAILDSRTLQSTLRAAVAQTTTATNVRKEASCV